MTTSTTTQDHDDQFLFENDPHALLYGDAYKDQIRKLRWYIEQHETGADRFAVLALEAGLGKSVKTNLILRNYLDEWGARRFLVVKKFTDDIETLEKALEGNGMGDLSVLGITANNWSQFRDNLEEMKRRQVVAITHARYIDLCTDEFYRLAFLEGRDTLIIDERVDFPTYSVSREKYNEIKGYVLSVDLQQALLDVYKPIDREIAKQSKVKGANMKVLRCSLHINKKVLSTFQEMIQNNYNQAHIKKGKIDEVKDFARSLTVIYNSTKCFYNNGRITCGHPDHKLWGLENNIILDANGAIDYSYLVSDKIEVVPFDKLIDHSSSRVYWAAINTSKSKIREYGNRYFDAVSHEVSKRLQKGMKTLLVIHLAHEEALVESLKQHGIEDVGVGDKYVDQHVAVNHFGNLVGVNDYRDFHQCWILGTYNLPLEAHIPRWMHYSEKEIGKRHLTLTSPDTVRFVNAEFEGMRITSVVGEIYQTIKRVQRNAKPEAEFFIFTKTEDVFKAVVDQLEGVEIVHGEFKHLEDEFTPVRKKKEETQASKLVDYLLSMKVGDEMSKKEIREHLGIGEGNFPRVLNSIDVQELAKTNQIRIELRKIIRIG